MNRSSKLLLLFLSLITFILFFTPPIPLGTKLFFIYDFCLLFWPFAVGVHLGLKKYLSLHSYFHKKFLLLLCLTLTIVLCHGIFRMDLKDKLMTVHNTGTENNSFGPFSWIQDGIIFARLLSWIFAVSSTYILALRCAKDLKKILDQYLKLLCVLAFIEGCVGVIFFHIPFLKNLLAQIYRYDPNSVAWSNRVHGTFQSPIEYGFILAIPVLWMHLSSDKLSAKLKIPTAVFLFFSKSVSPILAFLTGLMVQHRRYFKNKVLLSCIALFTLTVTSAILVYILHGNAPFESSSLWPIWKGSGLENKAANFNFRLGTWWIYLTTLFQRLDFFLFGLGFARGHADSSYLLFFRYGGLLLFSVLFFLWKKTLLILYQTRKKSPFLNWGFLSLAGFSVGALTTDCFIFRGAATLLYLLIALCLALAKTLK